MDQVLLRNVGDVLNGLPFTMAHFESAFPFNPGSEAIYIFPHNRNYFFVVFYCFNFKSCLRMFFNFNFVYFSFSLPLSQRLMEPYPKITFMRSQMLVFQPFWVRSRSSGGTPSCLSVRTVFPLFSLRVIVTRL